MAKYRIRYRRVMMIDSYLDVEADTVDSARARAEVLIEHGDAPLVMNEAPESYSCCYEATGEVDVLEEGED